MNTYKVIDEKTWERAVHCKIFRESIEPAFCGYTGRTGANADHRSLRSCCKIGEDEYEQEENRTIKNYIQ